MGREEDVIWKYVAKKKLPDKDGKERLRAKCNYCNYFPEAVANATRATEHILFSCKGVPAEIRAIVKLGHPNLQPQSKRKRSFGMAFDNEEDNVDDDLLSSLSAMGSPPSASASSGRNVSSPTTPSPTPSTSSSSSAKKKRTLWSHVDRISDSDQCKAQADFARAIYATKCPNNLFEHPLWKAAFNGIRPSFKPPQGAAVGGRLLNAEYTQVMDAAHKKIQEAPVVGIASDGWQNIRGEGLVNFIVTTPEPVFFKAIEVKDEREGGDFLGRETCKVIDEVGEKKVALVATDNCNANKVMWRIVEEKYPHISAVGDTAHVLNLLMQDFLQFKTFEKIEKMSRVLVNGIKKYRRPHAFFKSEQKRLYEKKSYSLKNYSKTRFSGILTRFKSVQSNKNALQSTVLSGTTLKKPAPTSEHFGKFYINARTKQVALDDNYFWERLPAWVAAMEPIANSLADLESDKVVLSDVPAAFYDIKKKCTPILESSDFMRKLIPSFERKIKERRDFVIKDVNLAANLLDPRYRGSHLSRDEKLAASEFIDRLCDSLDYSIEKKEEVLSNLTEFRAEAGFWARDSVKNSWRNVTPSVWWRGVCADEPLCPIAVRLLSVPGSSAATERGWSLYSRTHTKVRNRLLNHKTEKMVAVQMNLRYCLPPDLLPKERKSRRFGATGPSFPRGENIEEDCSTSTDNLDIYEDGEETEDEGEDEEGYEDVLDSDQELTDSEWEDDSEEEEDEDRNFDNWLEGDGDAAAARRQGTGTDEVAVVTAGTPAAAPRATRSSASAANGTGAIAPVAEPEPEALIPLRRTTRRRN